MMKAFQGENSSGKGGRTKGNIKKKKKKQGTGTESNWEPNNPMTECNAVQWRKRLNCLP